MSVDSGEQWGRKGSEEGGTQRGRGHLRSRGAPSAEPRLDTKDLCSAAPGQEPGDLQCLGGGRARDPSGLAGEEARPRTGPVCAGRGLEPACRVVKPRGPSPSVLSWGSVASVVALTTCCPGRAFL